MQKFAQRSNDVEEARIPWLCLTALRSPKPTFPSPSPAQATVRRSLHLPILFSSWETDPPDPPEPTWLRHDPGHQQSELRSSESGPMCPQRCDACGPSLSCLRRSRKSPLFCRLHALAIDDCCTGTLLAPVAASDTVSKSVMDLLPGPVVSPLLEVHIDRRVGWKVAREHAPRATATQSVEDGIDHRPGICRTRPASRLGCRKQATNNPPFRVAHVTRVSHRRILARLSGLPKHPLKQLPVALLKVEYQRERQLKEMMAAIIAVYMRRRDGEMEPDEDFKMDCLLIATYMVAFKNPAFEYEKEVRCLHAINVHIQDDQLRFIDPGGKISENTHVTGEKIAFRVRDNHLVASLDLPFKTPASEHPVAEIVLGPKNQSAPGNIALFLGGLEIPRVGLRWSSVPYR